MENLLLMVVLLLVGIATADDQYKCLSDRAFEKKLDEKHDRLFGTKTAYLTARRSIRTRFYSTQWPVDESKCRPVYLYLLSRHTIRYPKAVEITELRDFLHPLRDDIVKNGSLDPRFKDLAAWRFLMNETDDNQVSVSGQIEAAQTARIFYRTFPELLDVNKVRFEVGFTPKIRTKQTSDSFVDSLIREQIPGDVHSSQVDNIVQNIRNERFQESQNDILMSHRVCKTLLKKKIKKMKIPEAYKRLAEGEWFTRMLNKFSERIGLRYTLSLESLLLVHRACIYEDAILYKSPWCDLFTKSELDMIEYLLDISEYHDAHAIKQYRHLACKVTNDLYEKMSSIMANSHMNTNATLYFSHENLLSKVLSYLDLFDHFPSHNETRDSLCLPQARQWRSSNILSFGTNFAAVLYKCDAKPTPDFRILTLLNELPVTIRGCSSPLCPVQEFFDEFRSTLHNCDLGVICK